MPDWLEDKKGLQHLRKLLKKKSSLAYGLWMPTSTDTKELVTAASRFERWANQAGKQLKIEGWLNGD